MHIDSSPSVAPLMMMSSEPPPRSVSVNSLTRTPTSSTIPYQKTNRSTSTGIRFHEGHDSLAAFAPEVGFDSVSSDVEMEEAPTVSSETVSTCDSNIIFEDLPVEIHEAIVDHLFGERTSTSTAATAAKLGARSWAKALRHPRRKDLSNLALISPLWRLLVQERIYRHS